MHQLIIVEVLLIGAWNVYSTIFLVSWGLIQDRPVTMERYTLRSHGDCARKTSTAIILNHQNQIVEVFV